MAESLNTSVYIEEVSDANVQGPPQRFEFYNRELPEEIPFPIAAKLNEIEYPGGHRTNQIIGTYWQEIEWTGLFYGTYPNGQVAYQRMEDLRDFVGKIVHVGFPVPGFSGFHGQFVFKEFIPRVRNYLNIEYTIKLVPHERQEKIKPKEQKNVSVKHNPAEFTTKVNSFKESTKNQALAKNLAETTRYIGDIRSILGTSPDMPKF